MASSRKRVAYMGHPMHHSNSRTFAENFAAGKDWLLYLRKITAGLPIVITAPYLANLAAGENDDPGHLEYGLSDAECLIERFDGYLAVGHGSGDGSSLTDGMERERKACGGWTLDWMGVPMIEAHEKALLGRIEILLEREPIPVGHTVREHFSHMARNQLELRSQLDAAAAILGGMAMGRRSEDEALIKRLMKERNAALQTIEKTAEEAAARLQELENLRHDILKIGNRLLETVGIIGT